MKHPSLEPRLPLHQLWLQRWLQMCLQLSLQLRLQLTRTSWLNIVIALLLLISAVAWWGVMPRLYHQLHTQQSAYQGARQQLAEKPTSTTVAEQGLAQKRLQHFYETLGEQRYVEQQVKTLFVIAAKNGLILRQGDYQSAYDSNGNFHTYRVVLPVKGSYSAIRAFAEQVLQAVPFASLDEMNFKRESIANPVLETKLRFTLYVRGAAEASKTIDTPPPVTAVEYAS